MVLATVGKVVVSFNTGAGAAFFIRCYNISTHSLKKVTFLPLCPSVELQSLMQ